tara:strand:+ start:573 stop:728 length:156 start_codon:yes stop_codon:yes gene_type:complete
MMRKPTGKTLEAIKSQYKGGSDYTIEKKKRVIEWYKKAKAGKAKGPNSVNV